jgi:hypothetical protein
MFPAAPYAWKFSISPSVVAEDLSLCQPSQAYDSIIIAAPSGEFLSQNRGPMSSDPLPAPLQGPTKPSNPSKASGLCSSPTSQLGTSADQPSALTLHYFQQTATQSLHLGPLANPPGTFSETIQQPQPSLPNILCHSNPSPFLPNKPCPITESHRVLSLGPHRPLARLPCLAGFFPRVRHASRSTPSQRLEETSDCGVKNATLRLWLPRTCQLAR